MVARIRDKSLEIFGINLTRANKTAAKTSELRKKLLGIDDERPGRFDDYPPYLWPDMRILPSSPELTFRSSYILSV